jgi:signal transduction histidine kinase
MSKALGDPGLRLAYRVANGAWVDESGAQVDLTAAGERRLTYVGEPDAPLAALIHDPALRTDERLLGSVAAAARIALANIRLQAEVAGRVREVTESRRRLVEAAADERRRLGGEVETVAGRRLTAVAERLRAEPAPALGPLVDELEATREQLRRFASGLHPRELSERGLRAALADSIATSPIPVHLRVPELRFGAAQETTLYFVASEALANVAKHAQARHAEVVVDATDGAVRLRVSDNGVGNADPSRGSGIRGLADRVEALGGWLRLDSRAGAGTCLEIGLPLPSARSRELCT